MGRRAATPSDRVRIFTTGGTIATVRDPSSGHVSPGIEGRELVGEDLTSKAGLSLDIVELARLGSPAISPRTAFAWAKRVTRELRDPATKGAVLVMGTDVMEECAYLFDLLMESEAPVVLTGSMRLHSDADFDGGRNLADAIRVAASVEARGRGALVVMGGRIHEARHVEKTDPHALDAFRSHPPAEAGWVLPGGWSAKVVLPDSPDYGDRIPTRRIENRVACVKAVIGADSSQIEDALKRGARGLVIEAFADGSVTPRMSSGIIRALRKGIPVVIASRTGGRMVPLYTDPGENQWLLDRGAILAHGLTAAQARIKLMLALGSGLEVHSLFERFPPSPRQASNL